MLTSSLISPYFVYNWISPCLAAYIVDIRPCTGILRLFEPGLKISRKFCAEWTGCRKDISKYHKVFVVKKNYQQLLLAGKVAALQNFFLGLLLFPGSHTPFLSVEYIYNMWQDSNASCCDRSQVCYQWATHITKWATHIPNEATHIPETSTKLINFVFIPIFPDPFH